MVNAMSSMTLFQERGLSVVVEPAVLQEAMLKEDLSFSTVLSKFTTWKDGDAH